VSEASFAKAAAVKKLAKIHRKMAVLKKERVAAQVLWILHTNIDVDNLSAALNHFESLL